MPDALRLALGTLTALPVPPPRTVDQGTARNAMLLAPTAGLLLSVLPVLVVAAVRPWDHPTLALPAAVVVVISLALQTRAFHLDGLADSVDGLTAGYDRERALQVMRTGDVGPAGAAALVLVLLLQAASLAALVTTQGSAAMAVVALVSSRLALTWACVGGRAARSGGLGATVVSTVPWPAAVASTGLVLAWAGAIGWLTSTSALVGPVVVLSALAAAALVRHAAVRRLDGLTGDVLGATVEIAFASACCAALLLITLF